MTRPSTGRIVVSVLFLLFAISALHEASEVVLGSSDDPTLLAVLQTLVGAAGLATSVGSWRGDRWAPLAAIAYGVITGGMIVSLGPLLDLGADERPGLMVGGVSVLGVGLAVAWYLRRSLRRQV